jgi:hypothetical protein
MAQRQKNQQQVTTKNKKGVQAPKIDLSRLAMAQQVQSDRKQYQEAESKRSDRREKRGKWGSLGGLLGSIGGGALGMQALNFIVPGAGLLAGGAGLLAGAIATGVGAGLGTYGGTRAGQAIASSTITGDPSKVKLGSSKNVLTGKDQRMVSAFSKGRWDQENKDFYKGETQQMLYNSAIAGLTAGAGKYLSGARAAKAGADAGGLSAEAQRAVDLANTDPNAISSAMPNSPNYVTQDFASKYSNLGISPTTQVAQMPSDSARMFSYVSPKQGFVRNPMPTVSAKSGNNSMLNMLMKNLDNMR